jgi:hypothetical protein
LRKWYVVATFWAVEYLDDEVKAALAALPRGIRARFERISELIRTYGRTGV